MRIQAINNNTTFKGLFTDKTAENDGNWLMEYRPYSWENDNTSQKVNKERIDIFSRSLPDNEEIFIQDTYGESSKDILGTESYYKKSDGKMRTNIEDRPALNREESLKVLNRKLKNFVDMKIQKMSSLYDSVSKVPKEVLQNSYVHDDYAADIKKGYFARSHSLEYSSSRMSEIFNNTTDKAIQASKDFMDYVKLRDSADAVKDKIAANKEELSLIEAAKKDGKLIDISRRDIHDPNNALWKELSANIKAAAEKTLVLPHKTVSIKSLLKSINPENILNVAPMQVINLVDTLIRNVR